MSEEMDLGSREKSPESVELTPAIGVERGETPERSEISQEIVVGEPQAEADPKESRNQGEGSGNFDMQSMISVMQQLLRQELQELKENQKQDSGKIVRELQQVEERVVLNCQRSQEKLKDELSESNY
jgi:hypothetical protein